MLRKLLLLCGLMILGCGSSTQSYSVMVKNDGMEPMTVWLTKDGPPAEVNWLSPEQIAVSGKVKDSPISGVVIPPGKTGDLGPIEGRFDSRSSAVLRIYRGQKLFDEMLAMSRGSPNRTDLKLSPGANIIVIDKSGSANKK